MSLLEQAYHPEHLRKNGKELIDILSEHLLASKKENTPTIQWKNPEEQLEYWRNYSFEDKNPSSLFSDIITNSINVHNHKYLGHQVCPPAPLASLAGLISSYLNNGMAVYEMGATATAIEKLVVETVSKAIGYDHNADGFITSGGTLANLTALLAARRQMVDADIWEEGHTEDLAVMVSEEAHYCVDRALRIMGFGAKGIIKVPVDETYKMRTDLLDQLYNKAQNEGLKIIAVVGSAPSTSTGIHDDLLSIGTFCKEKKIWFHIDGAHGGGAVFSATYRSLLDGISQADSVAIDGHKMLMMPGIMTFLVFRNKVHSYETFSQKAQYLWEKNEDEEWYNLARRTFECTKSMMSIQFYIIQKTYGLELFDESVTRLYDLGNIFARQVASRSNLQLALEPESNIVCFRYLKDDYTEEELNALNLRIRRQILENGHYYIVQTILRDTNYLRVTIMNPFTDEKTIHDLLDNIEEIAQSLLQNTPNS